MMLGVNLGWQQLDLSSKNVVRIYGPHLLGWLYKYKNH